MIAVKKSWALPVVEGFEEQETKTNVSNIVDKIQTQIAKQQQRQTPPTITMLDEDLVFEPIDSDDSPIECEIASPDDISTTMPPRETSGVDDLDAIDGGPSDDDEETFREPSGYECRMDKLVECGYVDAQELNTTFPRS